MLSNCALVTKILQLYTGNNDCCVEFLGQADTYTASAGVHEDVLKAPGTPLVADKSPSHLEDIQDPLNP
jgi:hypothetical protein